MHGCSECFRVFFFSQGGDVLGAGFTSQFALQLLVTQLTFFSLFFHHQERGTGMILKLCRDVMNLEQLIQNGTVMGALTRVLQEEFKKSVELTFNILR